MTSYKHDEGKQKFLIPHEVISDMYRTEPFSGWTMAIRMMQPKVGDAILAIEQVLQYGLKKYGKQNSWKDVQNAEERYKDAYMRHMSAEEYSDKESGLPHYFHSMCNAMFLAYFELQVILGVHR